MEYLQTDSGEYDQSQNGQLGIRRRRDRPAIMVLEPGRSTDKTIIMMIIVAGHKYCAVRSDPSPFVREECTREKIYNCHHGCSAQKRAESPKQEHECNNRNTFTTGMMTLDSSNVWTDGQMTNRFTHRGSCPLLIIRCLIAVRSRLFVSAEWYMTSNAFIIFLSACPLRLRRLVIIFFGFYLSPAMFWQ